jgi:hypothetical protein
MSRRDPADFDIADVDRYICKPLALTRVRLEVLEFVPPSYTRAGRNYWTPEDLGPWLEAYHRSQLTTRPDKVSALHEIERALRPAGSDEEHRAKAMERWVKVATARSLTRRVP